MTSSSFPVSFRGRTSIPCASCRDEWTGGLDNTASQVGRNVQSSFVSPQPSGRECPTVPSRTSQPVVANLHYSSTPLNLQLMVELINELNTLLLLDVIFKPKIPSGRT